MTQKDNSDLYEYGRPGRGVGVGIMLALLAVSRAFLVRHTQFRRDKRRAAYTPASIYGSRHYVGARDIGPTPSG